MHDRLPQGEAVGRKAPPCKIVMIDEDDKFYVANQFQIFLKLRYFAMTGQRAMVNSGRIFRVMKTGKRFTMAIRRKF